MERTRCGQSLAWSLFPWMQTSSGLKLSFMNECERIKWKAGKFRLDICFLKIFSPKKFFFCFQGPLFIWLVSFKTKTEWSRMCRALWRPYSYSCISRLGRWGLPLLQRDLGFRWLCLESKKIGLEWWHFFFWFMYLKSKVVSLPDWLGTLSIFRNNGTWTNSFLLVLQQHFWTISFFQVTAFQVYLL